MRWFVSQVMTKSTLFVMQFPQNILFWCMFGVLCWMAWSLLWRGLVAPTINKITSTMDGLNVSGDDVKTQFWIVRRLPLVRQLSEWGMRGLQGSFPRLKDRIKYEERGERKLILQMIVLLYNFRASTVGQNQISSSFMPHLLRDANHFALNQ